MNLHLSQFVTAFAAGMALGFLYFGGLWFTAQRLGASRNPTLLVLGSFVARTGVALCVFYLVMDGERQRLLSCLLGFIVARAILVHRWASTQADTPLP